MLNKAYRSFSYKMMHNCLKYAIVYLQNMKKQTRAHKCLQHALTIPNMHWHGHHNNILRHSFYCESYLPSGNPPTQTSEKKYLQLGKHFAIFKDIFSRSVLTIFRMGEKKMRFFPI